MSKIETERKFLLAHGYSTEDLTELLHLRSLQYEQVRQGYTGDCRVRFSRYYDEGDLLDMEEGSITIKGKGSLRRAEFEYIIPPDDAKVMLDVILPPSQIVKKRYRIPTYNHVLEVDIFMEPPHLEGFVLIEIELPEEDPVVKDPLPPWVGKEVTEVKGYGNISLLRNGLPQ